MDLIKKYPSLLNWVDPIFSLQDLKTIQRNSSSNLLSSQLLKHKKNELISLIESVTKKITRGYELFCPLEKNFPMAMLHNLKFPTPLMYKGVLKFDKTIFSIVGSRKVTDSTKKWMKTELQDYLRSSDDLIVASGGAYGVDQLAHSISLYSQTPAYCVIPAGMNNIYPGNLKPMISQIIGEGGAVLSPFPPDFPIYKSNFYYRNRVLVLMSHCVLVAEARRRSGSMMTASIAAEFGVKTITLPQSVSNSYMGNLDLIEAGVPFVKNCDDLKIQLNGLFS